MQAVRLAHLAHPPPDLPLTSSPKPCCRATSRPRLRSTRPSTCAADATSAARPAASCSSSPYGPSLLLASLFAVYLTETHRTSTHKICRSTPLATRLRRRSSPTACPPSTPAPRACFSSAPSTRFALSLALVRLQKPTDSCDRLQDKFAFAEAQERRARPSKSDLTKADRVVLHPVQSSGYSPCACVDQCTSECACSSSETYCDRWCACPSSCACLFQSSAPVDAVLTTRGAGPRRFRGCTDRLCDSSACLCRDRCRECDPQICGCDACASHLASARPSVYFCADFVLRQRHAPTARSASGGTRRRRSFDRKFPRAGTGACSPCRESRVSWTDSLTRVQSRAPRGGGEGRIRRPVRRRAAPSGVDGEPDAGGEVGALEDVRQVHSQTVTHGGKLILVATRRAGLSQKGSSR